MMFPLVLSPEGAELPEGALRAFCPYIPVCYDEKFSSFDCCCVFVATGSQ